MAGRITGHAVKTAVPKAQPTRHVHTSVSTAVGPKHPPFRPGRKDVYLPDITLTLLRTPFHPPTRATFLVPLWLSKLDLRSYLYTAYALPVTAITSYVQQSRVTSGKPSDIQPHYNRWHRPRATKRMTVMMEEGFRWPKRLEVGKDGGGEAGWGTVQAKEAEKMGDDAREREAPGGDAVAARQEWKTDMAKQAKALREGREQWRGVGERGVGATG